MLLTGKRVVITGAAGPVGKVACLRFAEAGAAVIAVDTDDEAGRELMSHLREQGHDVDYWSADVSEPNHVQGLADHVKDRWGSLDVLYNNAGPTLTKPLFDTTAEEWDHVQKASVKAPFMMTRALAPMMRGRGASIINVASTSAMVGHANSAAYSAAAGGLVLLSKACAKDLAPDVRVNVLCPSALDAPSTDETVDGHMLGRAGQPTELISVALFLASDEASFMTGATVPVDGGWTAQ
jgi:NAD(P)-dependent dehydrogenase (short-subunit alcohol dehydrogenase family)